MAYRKRKERDTWHWRSDCSKFPRQGYEQVSNKPKSGKLCIECNAKEKRGKK